MVNLYTNVIRQARLALSAERKALNLVVVGSSPTVGVSVYAGGRIQPEPCRVLSTAAYHMPVLRCWDVSIIISLRMYPPTMCRVCAYTWQMPVELA